jgi:hypothetical protein
LTRFRPIASCISLLLAIALSWAPPAASQSASELYSYRADQESRWISPENHAGAKGRGGLENRGGKGNPAETLKAGQSLVLADIHGAGIIDRVWMTVLDRSPQVLRSLKLEMFWDGAATPAVSVPLGDFFLHGSGEIVPMDTALFASPEGRSFVSDVPMPFRRSARIVITNEATNDNVIFYDVDYRILRRQPPSALYFHAWWNRNRATTPGEDFVILPRIGGKGRFLGTSITVQTNSAYGKSWWGEGEVKVALDGDSSRRPTLVGTGTEDYIGSGWEQGVFVNRYSGSPVADKVGGRWSFYRFHVPDPIVFHRDIQVTLQQIGGAPRDEVLEMQRRGVRLIPVTLTSQDSFDLLLDSGKSLSDPSFNRTGWTWANFYRSDDVAAVAYFYLDRPDRVLPPIASVEARRAALRSPPEKK